MAHSPSFRQHGSISLPAQHPRRMSEVPQPTQPRMAASSTSGITTPNSSGGGSSITMPEGTPNRSVKSSSRPTRSSGSILTHSRSVSSGSTKLPMGLRSNSSDPAVKARELVAIVLEESMRLRCISQSYAYLGGHHLDGDSEKTLLDTKDVSCEHQKWQGVPDGTFPKTGKRITVKLICSCSEIPDAFMVGSFMGYPVTSDWEYCHLLQVSEMFSGVHRDAQKLYHAGREITPGTTIRAAMGVNEDQLPARCAIHVLVDRESFPQRLGPFSVVEVPLQVGDFILPKSVEGGFHWTMKSGVLERHGIRSDDARVTAQCSPTHPITLSDEERAFSEIPMEAVEFAWSYPVVKWEQVEQDPHVLDDWASCKKEDCALKDFLVVGGFVYLDQEHNIVRVTTPRDNKAELGGLQFGKPQKWQPIWTKALLGDGRFQRVTIGPLRDAGVRFFCWLRPGERFVGEDMRPLAFQPNVPHGGFAYLFHEMASPSSLECAVDCYFPVIAMHAQKPHKGESFVIVGQEAGTPAELVGHTSAQLHVHSMSMEDV